MLDRETQPKGPNFPVLRAIEEVARRRFTLPMLGKLAHGIEKGVLIDKKGRGAKVKRDGNVDRIVVLDSSATHPRLSVTIERGPDGRPTDLIATGGANSSVADQRYDIMGSSGDNTLSPFDIAMALRTARSRNMSPIVTLVEQQ